jgi:hypothetical protein
MLLYMGVTMFIMDKISKKKVFVIVIAKASFTLGILVLVWLSITLK